MQSLAVKYRPTTFEEVCSQESVIQILQRQIVTSEFKNCYMFCGASGCGKTTVARIFANAVNKGQSFPIEIDAASNNSVENVRQIIAESETRSLNSEYKVYIIDECHALSNAAWQAFLKCIEEPPKYTIFIFCTTDPQKIPSTILNRVMRFNFGRIASSIIKQRLDIICKIENFTNYESSIDYISKICHGGMRDAIALLDKCASYSTDFSIDNTLNILGNFSYTTYFDLIKAILKCNESLIIQIVEGVYQQGSDLRLFTDQFLNFLLDVNKYRIFKSFEITSIPEMYLEELQKVTGFDGADEFYNKYLEKIQELRILLKNDTEVKSSLTVGLLGLTRVSL